MNEAAMMALAKELAKGLKTESDLNDFTQAWLCCTTLFLKPSLAI